MGAYRKKPVTVEAFRLDQRGADRPVANSEKVLRWIAVNGGDAAQIREPASSAIGGPGPFTGGLRIFTLEGEMEAEPGDWVIRGVKGEFYPCKPDIFAATYAEVSPTEAPTLDEKLAAVERFCRDKEGVLALGQKGDGRWSAMLNFGREAPDSPMFGGSALGSGATLEEAVDGVIRDARIEVAS